MCSVPVPSDKPIDPAPGPRSDVNVVTRRAVASVRGPAVLLAILAFLGCALLGSCTRVRAALAVQGDDTVAGDVVLGTAGGPPPAIVLPPALVGRVSVTPYEEDGYEGSRLQFSGLRFDEVNSMVTIAPGANGRFRLTMRRVGNRISLNGQVDLTAVPVDHADIQLKTAFPGDVVSTDGKMNDNTVAWVFTPGQVSEFSAVIGAPDPAAPSVARWALLIAAIVAAAAVSAILLAKAHRNPPVYRSGRGP
jgi:hypothetical protein